VKAATIKALGGCVGWRPGLLNSKFEIRIQKGEFNLAVNGDGESFFGIKMSPPRF